MTCVDPLSVPSCGPPTPISGLHGGPDALGVPPHDFSSNSNACGPCPLTLAGLQACEASHYPDYAYTVLRQQLADFHGVQNWRIVLAGSASEFIYRITAWAVQRGVQSVRVPQHAYGDYAQAARAWSLAVVTGGSANLQWHADPSSPLGQSELGADPSDDAGVRVLDGAYEPLRLSGASPWSDAQRETMWQLWTPNKALGLTGVRAAYAIAPSDAGQAVDALNRLCASWPVGAHGVALLHSWVQPEVQAWLAKSRIILRSWKARQIGLLEGLGWACLPSEANFFVARPLIDTHGSGLESALGHWRGRGIKLRDANSFGLPGHLRLSVQPPASQDALVRVCAGALPTSISINSERSV